jgi:MFS family permease
MMTGNSLLIATSALVGYSLAEDKSFATLPIALQFLATMLTSAPASMLMRHVGRRPGFVLGATIAALGGGLATYAILESNFILFCAASSLIGMFNGFGNFYRFAAADTATEEFRSKAISYVMAGGVIAAFAGPNLANWSSDWIHSARFAGSYMTLIGVYIVSIVTLLFIDIPRPTAHERSARGRPLQTIMSQPAFIVAVLGGMAGYATMSLIMNATPLAMHEHAHPFRDTAFVIQWHVFGMFAPSFFTGHLIKRFGNLNMMMAGGLLLATTVAINLAGTNVAHFWFALFSLGIGWNFVFVGATSLLTKTYAPEEKAKTQGVNDFLVFSTVAASALTSGSLQHHFGWQAVNLGVIPLILCVLFAVAWMHRREAFLRAERVAANPP